MSNVSRFRVGCSIVLAVFTGGSFAVAQSNSVPGPTDYAAFSRFIAERNIFDPSRYPHNSRDTHRTNYRPRVSRAAPLFTLVGTMSYEKGMFAFFDGNQSDLRKVLYPSDSNTIAGFAVTGVALGRVTLQSADKKQMVELKIGDGMRLEENRWQRVAKDEMPSIASVATAETSAADDTSSNAEANSTPPSAGEENDILKKLMQQREQELK
jgi:hypothetical protein